MSALDYARSLADDGELRDHLMRAARESRAAALRPAPRETRLKRAGTAVRELGEVVTRAGAKAEAQRRARRRSTFLRALVLGGAGTAAAVAFATRNPTPSEA